MKKREARVFLKMATRIKKELERIQDASVESVGDDNINSVWDTATAARWAVGSLEGALERIVARK